jgi:hypothetical protein
LKDDLRGSKGPKVAIRYAEIEKMKIKEAQ